MSTPTATADAAPPKKKGLKILYIIVSLICVSSGAAVPMFMDVKSVFGKTHTDEKEKEKVKTHKVAKTTTIPFGDAVVNLAGERVGRYLRIKLVLLIDEEHEKDVTTLVTAKKAEMKSWLLGFLAGKTLNDVAGTVGLTRLQREIYEKFEDILYPEGHGHLKNVLFEEYVVQ